MERLLRDTPPEDLQKLFSARELQDSEPGPRRPASLAARFAAKEACLKLFPRETALGALEPADFSVARDSYGAPQALCSQAASDVLARHRIEAISLCLHDRLRAPRRARQVHPRCRCRAGCFIACCPIAASGPENLRRVFGEKSQTGDHTSRRAHHAHIWRLIVEFLWFAAADRATRKLVRIENEQVLRGAHARGKGVLVLTGHFGNFEVATAAGIRNSQSTAALFRAAPVQAPLAGKFVYDRSLRLGFGWLRSGAARPVHRAPGGRRRYSVSFRSARRRARRHRGRLLRASGRHVSQPRADSTRYRCGGGPGRHLARARRTARAALRTGARPNRVRRLRRGDSTQYPGIQRCARAPDSAASGAMVVDAPPLETAVKETNPNRASASMTLPP